MAEQGNIDLGKLFADLTCRLEDGAGLAAEGQRPDAPASELTRIADRLAQLMAVAMTKFTEIEEALGKLNK
ncbi:hypothetical protein [Roseovarius phycicola]|uniref:Uncharacterized protein n=1 Tax=Roseovarius phycicola TaxID=3080976 RepID=A0ABZ2HF93_9RHOB